MTRYRCKHAVEAMRWMGHGVLPLERWHRKKTGVDVRWTNAAPLVSMGDDYYELRIGEWLVWSSGEFLVMDDEQFRETYEEERG